MVKARRNAKRREDEGVLDMVKIFPFCNQSCRRLEKIFRSLRSLGMSNVDVRYKSMVFITLPGQEVISAEVLKFKVLACAHSMREAKVVAAELLLKLMGFTKTECLITLAARKKASQSCGAPGPSSRALPGPSNGAAGPSSERDNDTDMTQVFRRTRNTIKRLEKIVNAMTVGDSSLTVKYETHKLTSQPHQRFVKCTVGQYNTFASGMNIECAKKSASMLMLLKLGFQKKRCFLAEKWRKKLMELNDVETARVNEVKRKLFP